MNPKDLKFLNEFYTSFQALDGERMARCYADDAEFSDPVFPALRGRDIGLMWRMVCKNARDFSLEFTPSESRGTDSAEVRWDARYIFSKTRRPIRNQIKSTIYVRNGKIIRQKDEFSFWAWSSQALGPLGQTLGWTPIVRGLVRRQARQALSEFSRG